MDAKKAAARARTNKRILFPPQELVAGFEVAVVACPRALQSDLEGIFPGVDLTRVVTLMSAQRCANDITNVGPAIADEKDRLLESFVGWAAAVCDALAEREPHLHGAAAASSAPHAVLARRSEPRSVDRDIGALAAVAHSAHCGPPRLSVVAKRSNVHRRRCAKLSRFRQRRGAHIYRDDACAGHSGANENCRQPNAAVAAEICVTTIAVAPPPSAAKPLPPLKPNQPTQSIPVPATVIGRLCGII